MEMGHKIGHSFIPRNRVPKVEAGASPLPPPRNNREFISSSSSGLLNVSRDGALDSDSILSITLIRGFNLRRFLLIENDTRPRRRGKRTNEMNRPKKSDSRFLARRDRANIATIYRFRRLLGADHA